MNKTSDWCNGVGNCDDGYDEDPVRCENCNKTGVTKCEDSLICIKDDWLCDGFPQCMDMSDELSPQFCNRTCDNEDMFGCKDGTTCIPTNSTCNGLNNCSDASDESSASCEGVPHVGTFRLKLICCDQ